MLVISILSLLVAVPLFSSSISPMQLTRVTSVTFFFAAALSLNTYYVTIIGSGVSLYSGLFHVSTISQAIEVFLYIIGGIILLPWASSSIGLASNKSSNNHFASNLRTLLPTKVVYSSSTLSHQEDWSTSMRPTVAEYPLILLFTTMGASLLISSTDLVSMYLAIELQSFAVYVLAALYRNSETATSAGLKYFLLGALSSAFILLGSSIIYTYTGLTHLDSISYLLSSSSQYDSVTQGVLLGVFIIIIGFLFKVAAAPFHHWAPDVYDGVPTIVTTWLTVIPKISIFVFFLTLYSLIDSIGLNLGSITVNIGQALLLTSSFLSLIIGTVVGLAQSRIKRLISYSTISHVGFMLLALGVNGEESVDAFLFYLIQYSLTTLNLFLILLAFGYLLSRKSQTLTGYFNTDIQRTAQLKGQFYQNPLLALSIVICLFSIAGIPPLIGFFAKYAVLYTSIHHGYYFLSLVGILTSVISAAYYLRVVRVLYFDPCLSTDHSESSQVLTSLHAYFISLLTFAIVLFILQPSLIVNSTQLMAMSMYGY